MQWFAVNTRSRYEDYVAKQVGGRGYEVFLPIYKTRRKWSDRVKEIDLPLFPGYVFCRFDPVYRLPIVTTAGVIKVVGSGKTPIPVDEREIAAIQIALKTDLPREPWPFAQIGQKVRVQHGPLSGVEGTLLNVKGSRRLVLSVTLLQRSVALEIESALVMPLSQSPRSCTTSRLS